MAKPIPINRECKECPVGNGLAVAGTGPNDLSQVKLIIISDHAGHYEEAEDYCFVSNDSKRIPRTLKTGAVTIEKPRNAGSMIRHLIRTELGLDPNKDVWLTNVMKCNPKKGKPKEKDAKTCARVWLLEEVSELDKFVPEVPILIAGNLAFKAIAGVYKDCTFAKSTLKKCRKTTHHRLLSHPVFFTYNPASVAKSEWGIADTTLINFNTGIATITSKTYLNPFPLSPLWIYKQDLSLLNAHMNPQEQEIDI